MTSQRPTGIVILAVFLLGIGVLGLVPGILLLLLGLLLSALDAAAARRAISGAQSGLPVMAIGAVAIAIGLFSLMTAYGLLNLKRYGWYLAIVLVALSSGFSLVILLPVGNLPGSLVLIGSAGLIMYYLFRPHVRQAFRRP